MAGIEEFRIAIAGFADRIQRVRGHVKNEEATKLSLIQPFIQLLGYDPLDPTEVSAEHSADFSEKYKNRADYVVLSAGVPVIAIECKSVGNGKKDDRGQLKSYFNAVKSIKIGILTDGVKFEFFVDSNEPNMMDDDPYLTIDFDKSKKGEFSDAETEGLFALSKLNFNPEGVGETARRSIVYRLMFEYLTRQYHDPCAEFTRFLLKEIDIKNVRANSLDGFKDIAKSAFKDVFTASVLQKLDIQSPAPTGTVRLTDPAEPPRPGPEQRADKGIVTTQAELQAYEGVKLLLAFLVSGNTTLFQAISKIRYRDYQGKMLVYYDMERKGRLVDVFETKDGNIRFQIMDGGDQSLVAELASVSDRLKELFEKRVSELG